MRCPACGFVSFDHLAACKRCGAVFPQRGMRERGVAIAMLSASAPSGSTDSPPAEGARATGIIEAAAPEDRETFAGPTAAYRDGKRRAGFWLRSLAFLVDIGFIAALSAVGRILVWLAVQAGGAISSAPDAALDWLETMATTVLSLLIQLGYFTLFVGWRGQTPGKMLLGLRVVRVTGQEVGYVRALGRWVAQWISALLLGMGFLMIAFSRRKQGLHDKLAGTCVVRLSS